MKKVVVLIAAFAISGIMISCKKSYSCECTTTVTVPGSDPISSTRTEPITEKMTKKQGKAACAQAEKQMNDNNIAITYGLSDPSLNLGVTLSSTCTLK